MRRQGRAVVTGLAAAAVAAVALAACTPTARTTFPPAGSTPGPVGEATATTRQLVIARLANVGLLAAESNRPYRPAEGALLAAAPRTVLQVALPEDPNRGYILIYPFASEQAALAAARDHATYVATNEGNVQYPPATRFIVRVVGNTVVFFPWSPEVSLDPRTTEIENVLREIGLEVPVAGT